MGSQCCGLECEAAGDGWAWEWNVHIGELAQNHIRKISAHLFGIAAGYYFLPDQHFRVFAWSNAHPTNQSPPLMETNPNRLMSNLNPGTSTAKFRIPSPRSNMDGLTVQREKNSTECISHLTFRLHYSWEYIPILLSNRFPYISVLGKVNKLPGLDARLGIVRDKKTRFFRI